MVARGADWVRARGESTSAPPSVNMCGTTPPPPSTSLIRRTQPLTGNFSLISFIHQHLHWIIIIHISIIIFCSCLDKKSPLSPIISIILEHFIYLYSHSSSFSSTPIITNHNFNLFFIHFYPAPLSSVHFHSLYYF